MPIENPLKIMICDDQQTVRRLLRLLLGAVGGVEVVAEAADAEDAWARLVAEPVDLVLLDLELPGRHGFALLERIMRECPVPVIIISGASRSAGDVREQALALGAVGFIEKPDGVTTTHETLQRDLARQVAALRLGRDNAARRLRSAPVTAAGESGPGGSPLVAIGSSTGGIIAMIEVLKRLPTGQAPILITQHMLPGYADGFAARLCTATPHHVRVAKGGEVLRPGTVLVAPGNRHLSLRKEGTRLVAVVEDGDKISGHRPSCDVLFRAVAECVGASAVGLILTGMGRDGAEGLLAMRMAGARTLAQDEASCVVFGMPRAALELGAAERAVPLGMLGQEAAALLAGIASAAKPARAGRHPRPHLQMEILP